MASKQRTRTKKSQSRSTLQKPNGTIGPRVAKVGGDRFAIVCVDPAKQRSEWMMADYFGKVLIPPQTLSHQAANFKLAVLQIREAQKKYGIEDLIVVVERTGNYHLPAKRAFSDAGLETRVVHPFATRQFRMPANPGNKTDETDLHAQHRAAVAGFGLSESEMDSPYRELQLRARFRRNLVEQAAAIACQIREHLHLAMPGYAALFDHLLDQPSAMAIARACNSPAKAMELGRNGLNSYLCEQKISCQPRTIDKVLAWASQAAGSSLRDGLLHHAVWTGLYDLYQHFKRQIASIEQQLAGDLVQTPYVRLLAIPGINVVSAAELAGEMGPIARYANANAITGRSGLFPSRHQSDLTDNSGPLIRQANRRLRCALMRIAENLALHCSWYRGHADAERARGMDVRASRVKTAKRFTRLAFACVAGDEPMNHPAFRRPDSVLEKLREFHSDHKTPADRLLADMQLVVQQLARSTCQHEATVVAEVLQHHALRKRGGVRIGDLLPAVLARLQTRIKDNNEHGDRP